MVIQGISYPSDFEAKKAMIAAAAKLEAKGAMVAGDGSLSVRVGPNAIWITVEGADKAALTQDQMVRIDLNGKQMATNRPKPLSPDLSAHLKIYKENDSVQAVVHAYPVCAVVLGAKGQGVEAAGFSPSVRKLGRIQLTRTADPEGAANEIALLCKTDKGVVIPGDGCMMWGRSVSETTGLVEALDYYCKAAKCLGSGSSCSSHGSAQGAISVCSGECRSCPKAATCPDCRMSASFMTGCDHNCQACPRAASCPENRSNAAGSICDYNCQVCPSANAWPNCRSGASAPAAFPEVSEMSLPSGMTGLIRPGSPLPPLPEEGKEPAGVTRAAAPAAKTPAAASAAGTFVSPARTARIPGSSVPAAFAPEIRKTAPAAALTAAPKAEPAVKPELAIHVPKASVMAEVVRRSLGA